MFARGSPGFGRLGAQPHDRSAIGGTSENRFGMSGRKVGQRGGPELEGAAEHGDRLAAALCGGGNSGTAGPSAIGQTAAIYRGVSQASAGYAGRTAAEGTSGMGWAGTGEAFENIGACGLARVAERRRMFGTPAQLVRQHGPGVHGQGRRCRGFVLESPTECVGSFRG
jgi:hypothetical protein